MNLDELRKRAEERLKEREEKIIDLPAHKVKELVHELGTYQIELEIQNEDLRQAQEVLEDSRRKYSDLYDFAPVGYITLDRYSSIIEMNLTAARLLGVDRDKVLRKSTINTIATSQLFLSYISPGEKGRFREHIFEVLSGKERVAVEAGVKRNGDYFPAQFQISPFVEGNETVLRVAFMDITELKEAREAREQAEIKEREAKDEAELLRLERLESLRVLAGGIAHDLNNLMVAVSANAGLALRTLPDDSPAKELIEGIEKAVAKVSSFSRQILSFTGKTETVKENIPVNETVRDASNLLIASLSKNAALEFNFTEGLPPVYADTLNIQQVVTNLILNASDAIGDSKGTIRVSTGKVKAGRQYLSALHPSSLPEGEYVFIEVADTGHGMSEETEKRIFEPFFTTKFTGRGLGLPAVLGIVSGHGGAIGIQSEEGSGATFRVLLPVSQKPVEIIEEEIATQNIWSGKGTILVVDDDESAAEMAKKVLEVAGYTVLTANDGARAIRTFSENMDSISAVVMDLIMPSIKGDEAAKEIRKIKNDINILLLSGYHEIDLKELKEGPGKTAILEKPYKINKLLEKVQEIL